MIDLGPALGASAAAVLVLLLITFVLSIPMKDVSIVDVTWGLAFVTSAWVAALVADGYPDRDRIALVLVTLWGCRLAGYIALRKRTHPGEDPRYTRMRKHAPNWLVFSFTRIFMLQALLAWIVSIPLIGTAASDDGTIGPLVYVGIVLWAIGLFFEGVGDFQMSRFKADPANKGTVMNRGLWQYTRHPNYFGDFCVWWGLYAIAVDAGAWWSLPSPIIMTVLLTRVSGKDLLEKSMSKRPGYAEYVESTSGFFPRPPSR